MTIEEMIGQRLMGGFPGLEMDEEFIEIVKKYKIGGVTLFRHNVESKEQVKKLCADIRELIVAETGHEAFIAVDQEGGSVVRFTDDVVNVPCAMAVAATGDAENAYITSKITAEELRALGVNFDFAPVADVNNNPDNPIIGARCYGDTPDKVTEYALAAVKGFNECGILSTMKHFPGHGDTASDSHLTLPVVNKSLDEMRKNELVPFQRLIDAGCPAVMTTHILFPQVEKEKVPATMSRRIITGLLKEEMGFDGLVVSDCMEMDAIGRFYGTEEGTVEAMKAGVDIVLISHTPAKLARAAELARAAVESGEISLDELRQSAEKILAYKEKYCLEPDGQAGDEARRAISMDIRRKSVVLTGSPIPTVDENTLYVGCADYRSGLVSNVELNNSSFPAYMQSVFGGKAIVCAKDPDDAEIAAIAEEAGKHSSLVMSSYNGHLFAGQVKLIRTLGALGVPMALVALRNPYDLKFAPESAAKIAAWDYSPMTLEIVAEVLAGKWIPTGQMPVGLGEVR